VLGVNAVILGLIFLFIEPNPNDPLNKEAAELMRNNEASFKDNVKKSLQGKTINGTTFPKLI
jgi:ubiquitin-conjugating enzyme E2 M